jgi:glutathione reductase (NADPH)
LTKSNQQSLLKVVVNTDDSERVLGIHMVGDDAVEIVQSLALALKLSATKKDLDSTIGTHPSSAEEVFSM